MLDHAHAWFPALLAALDLPLTHEDAMKPLMILVAGPYRSGTNDDPARIDANMRAMNDAALRVFRAGHLPVNGEWFALPLIETAGGRGFDATFDAIFHPVAERVAARCDAIWRIGGASKGADQMVDIFVKLGRPVYRRFEEIPAPA